MNDSLRREVEELRKQTVSVLKTRYSQLFGEQSRSSNHAHLFRRIAWRLQAETEGDLTERARARAEELAEDVDLRLRAPQKFWRELAAGADATASRDDRLPVTGTVLKREFQGEVIAVVVLQEGFGFEGKTYESLSAIAWKVTGTRWNGFSFFGLNKVARS
jgi:hypothetical protein